MNVVTFVSTHYTAGRSHMLSANGVSMDQQTSAQQQFNDTYITANEICKRLNVAPSSVVHARRRGHLPEPIMIAGSNLYLWERTKVNAYLDAWNLLLQARRKSAVTG